MHTFNVIIYIVLGFVDPELVAILAIDRRELGLKGVRRSQSALVISRDVVSVLKRASCGFAGLMSVLHLI